MLARARKKKMRHSSLAADVKMAEFAILNKTYGLVLIKLSGACSFREEKQIWFMKRNFYGEDGTRTQLKETREAMSLLEAEERMQTFLNARVLISGRHVSWEGMGWTVDYSRGQSYLERKC